MVKSRYLREHERIHIADRLREKASIRVIAAELGRSPSTVSREIARNRTEGTRTLVERTTRYVLLVHLPHDRTAETVRDALAATMDTLPAGAGALSANPIAAPTT